MRNSSAVRTLIRNPFFAGLPPAGVQEVLGLMRQREVSPGEPICRAGDHGDSLFVILDGLAHVLLAGAGARPAAKLRRGDVVGEMSLLTDEPRSATVVAAVPTTVLELDRETFAALIAHYPVILGNLTRILSHRLRQTTAQVAAPSPRGEAVALLSGAGAGIVPELVEATRAASPHPVAVLDAQGSLEEALTNLDDALGENGIVLVLADLSQEALPALLDAVDRTVAIVANGSESALLGALRSRLPGEPAVELVFLRQAGETARTTDAEMRVVRSVDYDHAGGTLAADDARWLGRHIARTKLSLALGAGGAKGYAHIGALHVLEDAGYVVDGVAGSSIGAIVGAWLGLGMSAAEVEATMRTAFTPEVVEAIFQRSFTGSSTGLEALERVFRSTTHDATFADLRLPLAVMTVDLNSREPALLTEGPLWEALIAATALAGVFPPWERDGRRLVDGLALVPVPTDPLLEAGADVTLSVNLIGRETLAAWPGAAVPPPPPTLSGSRTLDTLLEVMDLAQLEAAQRQAAQADVVVTPRFGPSSWRDFHLADLFLEAGREAAEEQLAALESRARPQLSVSGLPI